MLVMPTIEYNIVEHCNLTCAHCDHASPYMPRNHIPAEVIGKDLARLAEAARFGELKLVGGEPLLHPDLLAVLNVCKSTRVAHKMTLATNGLLLHKLGDDALGLIDQLWISIYPDVKIKVDQAELRRRCAQARTRVYFVHMDAFRKTISGKRNDDRELLEKIYRSCPLQLVPHAATGEILCLLASFLHRASLSRRADRPKFEDVWPGHICQPGSARGFEIISDRCDAVFGVPQLPGRRRSARTSSPYAESGDCKRLQMGRRIHRRPGPQAADVSRRTGRAGLLFSARKRA
jgi:organic radical activating enzyme